MTIVVDASVTVAWCIAEEATSYTEAVLARTATETAVVPVIWSFEVTNALLVGQRRGRLAEAQVTRALQHLLDLPIAIDDTAVSSAWGPVLDLGRRLELASYDACYIELAMRLGLPLATIDVRQRDAAIRLGVPLVTAE